METSKSIGSVPSFIYKVICRIEGTRNIRKLTGSTQARKIRKEAKKKYKDEKQVGNRNASAEGEEDNIMAYNRENTRAEDQSGIQNGSLALSLTEVVHIGAKALLDINLTWFGYIARLS
jgi:hypothetical protein